MGELIESWVDERKSLKRLIRDLRAQLAEAHRIMECNAEEIKRLIQANEHWHLLVSQLETDNAAWAQKLEESRVEIEGLRADVKGWLKENSPGGWIDNLRVRVEFLEGLLKEIEEHPCCESLIVKRGHRCCAEIAAKRKNKTGGDKQ